MANGKEEKNAANDNMSCLLKHFIRKIKIKLNRRFILKIEVVYANVKVVMRELKILNI